jgi:hypothetical protein
MGVWQGVAMDSLKYRPGPPWFTFYSLCLGWFAHRVHRAGGLRPSSTPFDTPHRTPMIWGCISWGIQGLPKALLGPAMPYHGRFRGGRLQGGWSAAVLQPPWIPHAIRAWLQSKM